MSPRFDSLITTMGLMLDGDTTTAKWRALISGLLLTTLPITYGNELLGLVIWLLCCLGLTHAMTDTDNFIE
jgi:hypothetical protein